MALPSSLRLSVDLSTGTDRSNMAVCGVGTAVMAALPGTWEARCVGAQKVNAPDGILAMGHVQLRSDSDRANRSNHHPTIN